MTRQEALQAAIEQHYSCQPDRTMHTRRDSYYAWCCETGVPYVRVRTRRKFAAVEADMATVPGRLTELGMQEVWNLFERESERGARLFVSDGWPVSDKVLMEKAEEVAATLWAIITAPGRFERTSPPQPLLVPRGTR